MANSTDKSILTAAGKALLAQLNAEEKALVIDKMIFANVPNRPEYPQPDDVVPTDHIVHQEQVEQRGRLSADTVIYTTTLTSDVGPFDFNWTGAYCSEYGVLVTIDHHALTPKTEDEPGVTGNTLVRSVVLEYKDIAEITNITVDASSWQYNATPRMKKMDEDVAQAIIDQNGKDWFIKGGFLVTPSGSAYNIKAGGGYVSGNRVTLEFDRNVQVPNKPSYIYVDAYREGSPIGEWLTKFNIICTGDELDDHIDDSGVQHFVCKIAQVLADGSVSDLRPEGESASRDWVVEYVPRKQVENVQALKMLSAEIGARFETKYHTYPGMGSANYRVYAPTDLVPNHGGEMASEIADEMGAGFLLANGNYAIIEYRTYIHPEQWGLNNNLTFSGCNADRINAMIEYSAPYKWMGTVNATKAELGKLRARIFGGVGPWKIKKPILFNPFMNWEGIRIGAFYNNPNFGTIIHADFDAKDLFAIDAAPWHKDGVRHLGREYGRMAWDDGHIAGCMGMNVNSIQCFVVDGRNLRGTVNLAAATQSFVEKNRFVGGNIGVQVSVSWAGSLANNNIGARAIGIYNGADVTTYGCDNNYIYRMGNVPANDEFDWPVFPNESVRYKTAGIVSRYGNPHAEDNTIESFEHGIRGANCLSANYYDNYMEAITEYCYVFHTMSANVNVGYTACPDAELMWVEGSGEATRVKFDITGSQNVTVLEAGHVGYMEVDIVGAKNQGLGYKFNSYINFVGLADKDSEIYIDPDSGNDDNWGFFRNAPVRTAQGALNRCRHGHKNIIYCPAGKTIPTQSYIGSDRVVDFIWSQASTLIEFVKDGIGDNPVIDITATNDVSNLIPLADAVARLRDVDVHQKNSNNTTYSAVFYCSGNNDIHLINSNVTLENALISAKFGSAANVRIVHTAGGLNGGKYANENTYAGPITYIATANNTNVVGTLEGGNTETKKIAGFI
ncbi:phage tail-collar fiber domain-containing protein [Vibrio vulnificus]|uniref:phage tail-collar fiber domain-containing protein n=1 Tax=Vibrio vulnificus TaxID=672 RepID=UPI001CDD27C5|nr:phage tail protein [Vibrio vulnificus]